MALPDIKQAEQVHLQLDQRFYQKVSAASFAMHSLRYRNKMRQ